MTIPPRGIGRGQQKTSHVRQIVHPGGLSELKLSESESLDEVSFLVESKATAKDLLVGRSVTPEVPGRCVG